MSLQLLCRLTAPDAPAWRAAMQADREDQQTAGLTLLQEWHGADDATQIVLLFQVNDAAKARAWLDRGAAGLFARDTGARLTGHDFLRTA